MLFPFSNFFRQPVTVDRIDRYAALNSHRLLVGVDVSEDFQTVSCSLAVFSGRGKYLKLNHSEAQVAAIPDELSKALQIQHLNPSGELPQLLAELADIQIAEVDRLKRHAGKYVDRLLVISVTDPGIWHQDFDGQQSFTPACDPVRLAERSGISVIDGFPLRDIAAGGSSQCLEALPLLLIFADRHVRSAECSSGLVVVGRSSKLYFFPASDGLDDTIPDIEVATLPGCRRLDEIVNAWNDKSTSKQSIAAIAASGRHQKEREPTLIGDVSPIDRQSMGGSNRRDFEKLAELSRDVSFSDAVRTYVVGLADRATDFLERQRPTGLPIGRVFVDGEPILSGALFHELFSRAQRAGSAIDYQLPVGRPPNENNVSATVASVLGAMFVDQMPGNIPGLTRANGQRVLGRITPGCPASWRNLIVHMADSMAPTMKLKDAV